MKYWFPNIVTSLNLVFGMLSIFATLKGEFLGASVFIVAAMIADGLDGRVARYFNASSEFGKELDSLCDLVSFGAAPAVLAYSFMLKDFDILGYFAAIFFAACGAFRLARFNVNTGVVKGYFLGLPIPAGGCLLATFIMLNIKPEGFIFPFMVIVFGYLMVSKIRYPDFKGKGEKIRSIPIIVTALIAISILINRIDAVLFVPFISYSLFGVLNTAFAVVENNKIN